MVTHLEPAYYMAYIAGMLHFAARNFTKEQKNK